MNLTYDPLGRLRQIVAGSTTRQLLYDGANLVMEYDGANAIKRRYVFGQGMDEPLVWYEGSGFSSINYLYTDERGSIIATRDSGGAATFYAYDAFGRPANDNWTGSRFRYTGQIALNDDANVHLYYYKARVYDPVLGRFLQTDPIGYADGLNLYGYVHSDPINNRDPFGLACEERPRLPVHPDPTPIGPDDVVVRGERPPILDCDFEAGEPVDFGRGGHGGKEGGQTHPFGDLESQKMCAAGLDQPARDLWDNARAATLSFAATTAAGAFTGAASIGGTLEQVAAPLAPGFMETPSAPKATDR